MGCLCLKDRRRIWGFVAKNKLLRRLGDGEMGAVRRARVENFSLIVILKGIYLSLRKCSRYMIVKRYLLRRKVKPSIEKNTKLNNPSHQSKRFK